MRPSARPLRELSSRIARLTALSAGLLACTGCSGRTQPGALDGAAGIDRVDSGTPADGNAALDNAASWAADSMAPGDATLSAGDATASSVGSDGSTVPPDDAGEATSGADVADAGPRYLSDAGADAADAGPRYLSDAGPTSSMVTAYLNNPAHTSSALDPSLAPPLAAIWSFAPSRGVSISYPLIAGGHVYFVYWGNSSGSTAQLIAVDEHTGATIWGPLDLGVDRLAGQAYDGQQVFSADATGVVRSFDAATGAPGWKTTLSSGSAAQPTAYKGLLYVVTIGALTALDETTGHVTWTAPLSNGASATSPAVTDDGVFVSAACGDLSAFDRSTGSLLWHHLSTCGGFGGVPMIFDGRAYVAEGVSGGKVDMFDVRTGGLLGSLPCFIPPAFDEGQAYCNQRTPLEAFDLTTGAQAWSFGGDRQLNLGPFAAAGTVYVASDTGMMFGVDEATGAQVWSTEVDNLGASSLTVGGEGILLTQLYAGAGVVAYAHVDVPDASVVLGDSAWAAPVTLVPGAHPLALALDDTNVYWADFGAARVATAPKSGGAEVTLWSSTTTLPRAIAVDATNVYVVASGRFQNTPSEILAVPKAGATPLPLTSSPSFLGGPVVAGPSLLYLPVGNNVESVPETGGTLTVLPPGFAAAVLAVDGSNLYWSALDGIHSEPFSGGSSQLLGVPPSADAMALAHHAASAIAVDGTNVYYVLNSVAGGGSVGYVPITGGPATVLAKGRLRSLVAIAVDDRNVYWVEGEGKIQQGAIAAVPKTGGQVTVLVSGLSDPSSVAVDSTGVYFPSTTGIGKIPK